MGTGLEGLLVHLIERAGLRQPVLLSSPATPDDPILKEVYRVSYPAGVKETAVAKIVEGGLIREAVTVQGLRDNEGNRLHSFPDVYSTIELQEGKKTFLLVIYEYSGERAISDFTHMNSEHARNAFLQLARDLHTVHTQYNIALVDVKPSNMVAKEQLQQPKFIDFQTATAFGNYACGTSSFEHPVLHTASAQTDTYKFVKTIDLLARKHRFIAKEPFTELHRLFETMERGEDTTTTLETVISILEKPDKERTARRKFIGTLLGTAIGSAVLGGGALVKINDYIEDERVRKANNVLYEESENAILDNFTNSRNDRRELYIRLSKKLGSLVTPRSKGGAGSYVFDQALSIAPELYFPTGAISYSHLGIPEAAAFSELLFIASDGDKRTLGPALFLASKQKAELTNHFTVPNPAINLYVEPLLHAYHYTGDETFLFTVLQAAKWCMGNKLVVGDHTIIPFRRNPNSLLPTIMAWDVRMLDVLLAGDKATQLLEQNNAMSKIPPSLIAVADRTLYERTCAEMVSSLRVLIDENHFVHESMSYDEHGQYDAPFGNSFSQADIAFVFAKMARQQQNATLLQEAKSLHEPFLAKSELPTFYLYYRQCRACTPRPEIQTAAEARLLRAAYEFNMTTLDDTHYTPRWHNIIRYIPKAEFIGRREWRKEWKRKELLGGACTISTSSRICNVGMPWSDADVLSALRYSLPAIRV
jgi:hypothetical protein